MITGITVCVDYWDILDITIDGWRNYCDEIIIITDMKSLRAFNEEKYKGLIVYGTDAFYRNGATFNKGLAIEEVTTKLKDYVKDWVVFFDADILIPHLNFQTETLNKQNLYTPHRKIIPIDKVKDLKTLDLDKFPVYPEAEFAGYFQLFHKDSVERPWYSTDWKHAGGCDSDFQAKFKQENKIRPNFYVYHLGEPGINWNGRAQPYVDGSKPDNMLINRTKQTEMFVKRRVNGGFSGEKLWLKR
jgi:hypothetical protein